MKILLVDDHALFRAGLRLLLNSMHSALDVSEVASASDALAFLQAHKDVSLCLLDLSLEQGSGLEALGRLKEAAPETGFVIVSAVCNALTVRACLQAGAMSYVPKSMPPATLRKALDSVLAGHVFLPDEVLDVAGAPGHVPALSPRQFDALRALARGLPTKLIARELAISEHTAREHVSAVFAALEVHNRTEAVIKAGRLGLLGMPPT